MLNAHRLRLLVELSDRGTIRAVADALHYTPSAVSEGLSALEREVGLPLLERSASRVRLNSAGERLAEHGRDIVDRLHAAGTIARGGRFKRHAFAIATFPSAGATLVASVLAELNAGSADLRIEVIEAERDEALEHLAAGEVDLAVVYAYGLEPALARDGIVLQLLKTDPIELCVPADRVHEDVSLAELSAAKFVAGRRGTPCHAFTTAACRAAGFEPDIAYETDDIALTGALVKAGLAVALMPRALLDSAPTAVPVARARPHLPPRRILLARREVGGALPPAAEAARRLLTTSGA